MRIGKHGILQVRIVMQDKPPWCAVCPVTIRQAMLWQTHGLAQSGVAQTLEIVQFSSYWSGMQREVRKLVQTCEVCQSASKVGLMLLRADNACKPLSLAESGF